MDREQFLMMLKLMRYQLGELMTQCAMDRTDDECHQKLVEELKARLEMALDCVLDASETAGEVFGLVEKRSA